MTAAVLELPKQHKCEQCAKPFEPRSRGGKPQRFCSADCRQRFNNCQRFKPGPQRFTATETLGTETLAADAFDWSADDSIVLHHQPAVAVYINQSGGLTIRQERDWCQEDDSIVVIAPENVTEFVDKLTDIVGIPGVGK